VSERVPAVVDDRFERFEFADPHGHLARWVGVEPVKDGRLRVSVSGSAVDKARFREQIEAIAEQGPRTIPAVDPKFRAVFGR
jgi:hypothetical protein